MKPLSVRQPAGDGLAGRLRLAFDASALSLTVGAEEELMLVEPVGGGLVGGIEDVLRRAPTHSRLQAEFRAAQVELATRPCLSAADVGRELAFARVELHEALAGELMLVAAGSHPTARDLGPITNGERYRALAADNPWAARHMLTCGLHVHVGLADADRALAVHNALRSYLPELASLSANSPYHESLRTGLASTRLMLNRSLVRHGVPPAFPDWGSYAAFVAWGQAGGSIPDSSYHWWDLRLHPDFGTLEVRVCDTQTDVADVVALVALVQTLVARLAERYDDGETLPVHDGYRIAENVWVAASAAEKPELLDLDSGARRPAYERVAELVAELEPTARELGAAAELARLPGLAMARGADRQLRLVREHGVDGLVDWLGRRTVRSAREYAWAHGVALPSGDTDGRGQASRSVPASA
ncbi:MAG: YbdK family carboxylate-amine ligase [Gaiella sp.]|nr:YbdK family carboxylate-amine ligase [Gaiella sp.]